MHGGVQASIHKFGLITLFSCINLVTVFTLRHETFLFGSLLYQRHIYLVTCIRTLTLPISFPRYSSIFLIVTLPRSLTICCSSSICKVFEDSISITSSCAMTLTEGATNDIVKILCEALFWKCVSCFASIERNCSESAANCYGWSQHSCDVESPRMKEKQERCTRCAHTRCAECQQEGEECWVDIACQAPLLPTSLDSKSKLVETNTVKNTMEGKL